MYADPSGYAKNAEKQKICGPKESGSKTVNPNALKPTHTMYNVDKSQVIGLIDEAWVNKGQGIMQRNGNVKYEIDMGRVVGANGETSI